MFLGVLKRQNQKKLGGARGGWDFGGALGRKTMHLFLWPWLAKISEQSTLLFKSYRPQTMAAEEKKRKKFWQNHKAFPVGSA